VRCPDRPRRRGIHARLLLGAWLAAGAPLAGALGSDRTQAMDITARSSSMQQDPSGKAPGTTVLRGDVKMVQGSLKASADQATIYQKADGGVSRAILIGKPAHLEQKQENGDLVQASAGRIDYRVDSDLAELTGDVVVTQQNRGEFRGDHMTYNTATGTMESGDDSPGSRVHMRIAPKPQPDAAGAKPPPAATGG
jgi:lipopolysaccharide export system protein LptA